MTKLIFKMLTAIKMTGICLQINGWIIDYCKSYAELEDK